MLKQHWLYRPSHRTYWNNIPFTSQETEQINKNQSFYQNQSQPPPATDSGGVIVQLVLNKCWGTLTDKLFREQEVLLHVRSKMLKNVGSMVKTNIWKSIVVLWAHKKNMLRLLF